MQKVGSEKFMEAANHHIYTDTIKEVTTFLKSHSIEVQLKFDFDKQTDINGYYHPGNNEIMI